MMLKLLNENPGHYFAIVLVVVVSIVLHELAHGAAAIYFGDRTPIETGHMTPNPLVHMGWMSLILLAVVGIAWGQMPVDPRRMRGRYADFWVSFAGPLTNLVLAGVGMLVYGLLLRSGTLGGETPSPVAANGGLFLWELATTNVVLFLLNLIPIPPLDGSRMLANVSPGYRRLLSGDFAKGLTTAALFGLFFGGGTYLFAAGDIAAARGITFVAGLGK